MSQEETRKEMESYFGNWDPVLMKIVRKMRSIQNYPLFEVVPFEKRVSESGKFMILGDAAHAMVPYLSMRVSMAVEDSAALAESISFIDKKTFTWLSDSSNPCVSIARDVSKRPVFTMEV
ncbi:hypothetical protein VTN00DRAFT_8506 [Thermoascus crustaceus]|uniref:uncharacterized protein n=1 Tax=Thermoascus crustaceus TaxID=5088 RepID=UPI0037422FA0